MLFNNQSSYYKQNLGNTSKQVLGLSTSLQIKTIPGIKDRCPSKHKIRNLQELNFCIIFQICNVVTLEVVPSVSKKPLKQQLSIVTHKTSILWSAATTMYLAKSHSTKHCISIPDNLNDKQELGMYQK